MAKTFLVAPTIPALPSPPANPAIGDFYYDTSLGKIGIYTSSGWRYFLYQIEDGSVTTSKIADGAVTAPKLAPGAVSRIFQQVIGDGTSSAYTITHNLNTTNIEVSLTLLSTNEKIGARVVILNNNQISVSFISPIATNSVSVVVIG